MKPDVVLSKGDRMRNLITLSCAVLFSCAASKAAVPPTALQNAKAAYAVETVGNPEVPAAVSPVTATEPQADDPPAKKGIQINLPDEHWKAAPPNRLPEGVGFMAVHDETGAMVAFMVSKNPVKETLTVFRAQDAKKKNMTVSPLKFAVDGKSGSYDLSIKSGDGKGVQTLGRVTVRELDGMTGGVIAAIGLWPSKDNRAMSADYIIIVTAITFE